MKWDVFTILEQLLILLVIASQLWIAVTVILKSKGAEQYVRLMSFATGFIAFLITRALGVTFADMMLVTRTADSPSLLVAIGAIFPFLVGVLISEGTIQAMRIGMPIPIRLALMIAAFTLSQASYTNYIALSSHITTLDKAFVPNLSYAIAVGLWLTFRYRDHQAADG